MKRLVRNGVAHFDIAGPKLEMLSSFYGAVFGWEIATRGPGYATVTTPEASADGALVEAPEPSLTVGIVVPDLNEALASAIAAGGSIAMPATDNGWVTKAQIVDPAGNHVTLIKG